MSQYRLMQAALHGADFPMAKKLRKSMSTKQLHEFTDHGPLSKADHVGDSGTRKRAYQAKGMSEHEATKRSIKGKR
jgi:hypothetical protein